MPTLALKHFFNQNTYWPTTVVFDTASASGYEASLSTYNWSHTTTTRPNRYMVVGVSIFATGTVSSVTYGGQALTFLRSDTNGVYRSELWYMKKPLTGTNTVEVTLSASLTSIANAQTYYNAAQTGNPDANNGANGTNTPASASITTVADLDTVVGNLAAATASGVISAVQQNPRTSNAGALGTGASDDFGDVTPAGSKTLSWTGMGVTDSWAVSLLALKPATGAGVVIQNLAFMMVG